MTEDEYEELELKEQEEWMENNYFTDENDCVGTDD